MDIRRVVFAIGDGKPCPEIIPEGDAELGACLGKAEECIAAGTAVVAAGASAYFSLGDMAAYISFRAIGVQWGLRSVEHHQQFWPVGVEPGEQAIKHDGAGPAFEDPVEPGAQAASATDGRITTIACYG